MKTHAALAASALFLGLAGPASAAQILSPALPTSNGTSGACYIRNTGTTPITVQVSLFSNNSIVAAQYHDSCSGVALAGGHTCWVLVDHLPEASFAACRATSGSIAKVRGTLEIRAIRDQPPTLRILVSEDLR